MQPAVEPHSRPPQSIDEKRAPIRPSDEGASAQLCSGMWRARTQSVERTLQDCTRGTLYNTLLVCPLSPLCVPVSAYQSVLLVA